MAIFRAAMLAHHLLVRSACSRIGTMMFSVTVNEENKAPSWNCTPVRRLHLALGLAVQPCDIDPEHLDRASGVLIEADDGAQQHGLAGARPADQADNLATKYVEIEIVVDDVVAELRAHVAQSQHDVAAVAMVDKLAALQQRRLFRCRGLFGQGGLGGHQTSANRKMIEKIASSTITQKIDSTTDLVVSWPTLSALPRTCRPSKQPMVAMTAPNTGALIMPV